MPLDLFANLRNISSRLSSANAARKIPPEKRLQEKLNEFCRYQKQVRSNLVHDIRTPLNNIKMSVDMQRMLFKRMKKSGLPVEIAHAEQFEKYFATIIGEIRHINLHIDQILELERNPMEDMNLNLQEHHLKRTLLTVLQKFESLYADESRRFELDCRTREEYFFYDRGKLERMLTNLLSNAVKYTPTGKITLRALEEDSWLVIEVEDTGSGIPQDKLTNILERFSRAEGRNQQPGTGLGLNIIHHMVKLHSGELIITSREGEGSTFALKIPKSLVNASSN